MSEEERLLYFALAAAVAGALALIWLTGALAGLLFGSGWAPIGTSDLVASALRLPFHLGDPRAAWPPATRPALPGPVGFYATGALLAVAAALAVHLTRHTPIPSYLPRSGGDRRPPAAHWAKRKDLAPLLVPAPQPGRLTLGTFGRSLLAAEERQSVIVFAPTGTYKTTGLAIPALLEWQGPALVTSVKNDLLDATMAARDRAGEVMVFDPLGVSGVESTAQATPLWGADTWDGARRVAHWLCSAAQLGKGGLQDADFWFATAEKLLAPLLFAAATGGETMADVVRWLDEGPEANQEQVAKLLRDTGEEDAELAWTATLNREERQRSSVYTTAEVIVSAFADKRVKQQTAEADYTPEKLLAGEANTLYLCAPLQEQERLRAMFSMFVQEALGQAYEKAALDGPLNPPLLILHDEAANVAPLPNLDAIASTAAGHGIQLLSIFHDMAQVRTVYGPRAATIANNYRGKVFGPGLTDREALEYLSRVAGHSAFEQRSRSNSPGGQRSTTEGETYRELAPANLIRERDAGTALLVYHNLPLAKIGLRLEFKHRTCPSNLQSSSASANDNVQITASHIEKHERNARIGFVQSRQG